MASRIEVLGTAVVSAIVVAAIGRFNPRSAAQSTPQASAASQTAGPTAGARPTLDTTEVCLTLGAGERLCGRSVRTVKDSVKVRTGSGRDLLRQLLGAPSETARCTTPETLDITIVTLPDPVDSHLDWGFDGGLEAMNRAFERAGYVADRFWLPWASAMRSGGSSSSAPVDTARKWVRYPGALLFRRASPLQHQLHLVYIVGEIPTVGLHQDALQEALAERESLRATVVRGPGVAQGDSTLGPCLVLAPGSDTIRIVGPALSGSVPSLANALARWQNTGAHTVSAISIISGSATNDDNHAVLNQVPGTRFSATVYPSSSLTWFIDKVLARRMGIPLERIAMLTEGSTQFGQLEAAAVGANQPRDAGPTGASQPRDSGLLSIPFPINIASLRAEYARHPVVPSRTEEEQGQSAPRVPLSLTDPALTTERPGLASTQLTVPAADLAVREILRTLQAHRVRAVGIAASDVRDQLFLAEIIKEHLSDVQLFMVGSNILFLRPDLNEALLGTLIVSTYPLFLENQFWDPTRTNRARLMFTSDVAEGIYNATLMQLGADTAAADYSRPIVADTLWRPPLWVTTVGRDALYPVTIGDSLITDTASVFYKYVRPRFAGKTSHAERNRMAGPPTPPETAQNLPEFIFIALLLMVGFPAAYFMVHMRTSARAARDIVETLETEGATVSQRRRAATEVSLMQQRELFVALRFLAVCVLALAVTLTLLRPAAHGDTRYENWLGLALLPLLGIGLLLVGPRTTERWGRLEWVRWGIAYKRSREEGFWSSLETTGLYLLFAIGALYITLVVLYVIQVIRLGPILPGLYFQRAVHFGSGVSPLAPVILGAIGFGAWSWWHLERIELLQCRTEFEEACTITSDPAGPPVECGLGTRYTPLAASVSTNQEERRNTGHSGIRTWLGLTRVDGWLDRTHKRTFDSGGFAIVVGEIRKRLLYLLPTTTSRIALIVVATISWWLSGQFALSMDAAVTRWTFPKTTWTVSPFDALLRFATFGALFASVWALHRFISVWRLLARLLSRLDESPLASAFSRVPSAIAQLTRIRLFPQATEALVEESIQAKWDALERATAEAAKLENPVSEMSSVTAAPTARWTSLVRQRDWATRGIAFCKLYGALCDTWRAERVQAPSQQRVTSGKGTGEKTATGKTAGSPADPNAASPRQKVMTAAEDLAAVYLVDYIEWVFGYLRGLAAFLLVTLVLMSVLIVSYPFQPASIVRTMYFLIIGVTVVTIVAVLVRMNRDPILSSIAGTNANELTWDARFVLNLVTFAAVPILTLLGSEFPALRGFLFAWVSPALKVFTQT